MVAVPSDIVKLTSDISFLTPLKEYQFDSRWPEVVSVRWPEVASVFAIGQLDVHSHVAPVT